MQSKLKKTTTNKSLSISKKRSAINRENFNHLANIDDCEYLFLEKVVDKNGISIINIDDFDNENKHLICSKYGATPLISYGNTNFNRKVDKIIAVKKFDKKYFDNSADNAVSLSNKQAVQFLKEYENELEKINLIKQKNLLIAKIDSMRILNKAIALEKSFNERKYEQQRHKEAILEIKNLHKSLLEKNDIELKENTLNLKQKQSVDLNKLISKRNKQLVNLDRKYQIEIEKRNYTYDKIECLSQGDKFEKKFYREKITNINNRHKTTYTDGRLIENSVEDTANALSKINYAHLSNKEKKIYDKFFLALDKDNQSLNNIRILQKYHQELIDKEDEINETKLVLDKLNNRKAYIVSTEQYNKIIDAKKKTFSIVVDAVKFANSYKTLYQTYLEMDQNRTNDKNTKVSSNSLVTTKKTKAKANNKKVSKTKKEKNYANSELNEEQIKKWRKIKNDIMEADDYDVVKLDDGNYQIEYKNAKNPKIKKEAKSKSSNLTSARSNEYYDSLKQTVYEQNLILKNLKRTNRSTRTINASSEPKVKYFSIDKINKLKNDFLFVYQNQLTYENIDFFDLNNVDLDNIYANLRRINPNYFVVTKENEDFIKNVQKAVSVFNKIEAEEYKREKRKISAQKLYAKLNYRIDKKESTFAQQSTKIENRYLANKNKISARYVKANEYVNSKHFINKESIIEHEIAILNKEDQNHLNNLAWYKANIDKFYKLNYKYQSTEISKLVKNINAFNKHNLDNQISLDDLPTLIYSNAFNRNNVNIKLSLDQDKLVASTFIDKNNVCVFPLNKNIPTNVKKIYVLDKFRNVKDPAIRSSLLKELSSINYDSDLKYIDLIEQKQIEKAKLEFKNNLKKVDKIRDEAEFIRRQGLVLGCDSKKMSMIADNELRLKKTNWSVSDYEAKLYNRQLERELKLQDKIRKLENK